MNSQPAVSVVIPLYNKEELIIGTIDSVLNQTFTDLEVIIVDDGSTDGSCELVKGYGDRVRLHVQSNAGPSAARNKGVELSNGKYIAFLDADDQWLENKLEQQYQFLEKGSVRWCSSNYVRCGSADNIETPAFDYSADDEPWQIYDNWFVANKTRYRILTSGVMVQRSLLNEAGPFDLSIPAGQDVDLWIRIAQIEPQYAFSLAPLFRYYEIPDSVSKPSRKKFESVTSLFEKHIKASIESGNESYQDFIRSRRMMVMRRLVSYGHPQLAKRLFHASPKEWRSGKFKFYYWMSKLPVWIQRKIAATWRSASSR